jgi:large subunit ribosomal protein L28
MSSVCDICGKTPGFGKSVSFSHKRNNRRWNPNIQRVRAMVKGTPKRVNACVKCLKAGRVVRKA